MAHCPLFSLMCPLRVNMALYDNNSLLRLLTSPYCKAVPGFVKSSITFFNKISLSSHTSVFQRVGQLTLLCDTTAFPLFRRLQRGNR